VIAIKPAWLADFALCNSSESAIHAASRGLYAMLATQTA